MALIVETVCTWRCDTPGCQSVVTTRMQSAGDPKPPVVPPGWVRTMHGVSAPMAGVQREWDVTDLRCPLCAGRVATASGGA